MDLRLSALESYQTLWNELCSLLDDRWNILAKSLKTKHNEISIIEKRILLESELSPSSCLLNTWKDSDEATLVRFIEILRGIHEHKAIVLIYTWIKNQLSASHPLYELIHHYDIPLNDSATQTPTENSNDTITKDNESNVSTPTETLDAWLKTHRVEVLASKLQELGAETVEDLKLLDQDMIIELADSLKYIPRKKFLLAMGINTAIAANSGPKESQSSPLLTSTLSPVPSPVASPRLHHYRPEGEQEYADGMNLFWKDRFKEAFVLLEKAAQKEFPPAMVRLQSMYTEGVGCEKSESKAKQLADKLSKLEPWFIEQASIGNPVSQFNLAFYYDMKDDHIQSVYWYQKSAEQGFPYAQYYLGLAYCAGEGVAVDYEKAVQWFHKAADQGDPKAQCSLGAYFEDAKQDDIKAVFWYQKSAEQGNAEAQCNLGKFFKKGIGVPQQDYQKAVYWFQKAVDQEYPEAMCHLGRCYYRGKGVPKNYEKAVELYEQAAERNFTLAQCRLGWCYETGKGVTKDYKLALYWYQRAADEGSVEAQNNLGFCYKMAHGVPQDYAKAAFWFEKAAEQGHIYAQCDLAFCYKNGQGVEQDLAKSVFWFRKAAEQNDKYAQFNLGKCYYNGQGIAQDFTQAVFWFLCAADQGDAEAQYNAGYCYKKGHGVPKDYVQAFYWFQRAANQDYSRAQYCLGECYRSGLGTSQDFNEAVNWYQKAADQGYARAQFSLGLCYHKGYGVNQDYTLAAFWYKKAMEAGNKEAKKRYQTVLTVLQVQNDNFFNNSENDEQSDM